LARDFYFSYEICITVAAVTTAAVAAAAVAAVIDEKS